MEQNSTSALMNILKNASKEDISRLEHSYLPDEQMGFVSFMDQLICEKNLKRQDIFQKADLPQKYGYKLLSGESHTTDRDKLLRLFIAMKLTLKQVQRALALYGLPALYPKKKRDAVLIIAINKAVGSVETTDDWLREAGQPTLARSRE